MSGEDMKNIEEGDYIVKNILGVYIKKHFISYEELLVNDYQLIK